MLLLYSATAFLSSFLLFLIQPLVGKNILPMVGGSPAAWNSCMLFFQITLLAGYVWAHLSTKKLGTIKQSVVQLVLVAASLLFFPLFLEVSRETPADPAIWLITQLFKTIGLPFFALCGLSPILQLWFSKTEHSRSTNPYFLFSAGNAGSLIALIAYPLLLEPFFSISQQANLWKSGFVILLVMLFFCRKTLSRPDEQTQTINDAQPAEPASLVMQIYWVIASFLPSGLLLAATQFLTTDIAPVPLLWVLPLIVYLTTFIIAFSGFELRPSLIEKLARVAILLFPAGFFLLTTNLWLGIPLNLFVLFAVSLYCHGFLAVNRPPVAELTKFYALISLGGTLGGAFITLIVPQIFTTSVEYPLLIVVFALLLKHFKLSKSATDGAEAEDSASETIILGFYAAAILALANQLNFPLIFQQVALFSGFDTTVSPIKEILSFLTGHQAIIRGTALIVLALFPVLLTRAISRVNLALFSLIVMTLLFVWSIGNTAISLARARNFFGVKKVQLNPQLKTRSLMHGTTLHGTQSFAEDRKISPLTYFHPEGPIGSIFSSPGLQNRPVKVAVIGLGIGTLAAYAKPEDEFVFYEIDPQVIALAGNSDFFTFLSEKQKNCRVICGDGRKMLKSAQDKYFDLIFFDAFSSGSIPVHLVTREAIAEYLAKLTPDGLLIMNITNRYINLRPVLASAARAAGLIAITVSDDGFDKTFPKNFQRLESDYVVFARSGETILHLLENKNLKWDLLDSDGQTASWTDDYSSLLSALNFWAK